MTGTTRVHRTVLPGIVVAAFTAAVSGVSVFVNGYGVHAVTNPSVYTTAKNLVATVILAGAVIVGFSRHQPESALGRFVAVNNAPPHSPSADGSVRDSAPLGLGGRPLGRRWSIVDWLSLAYVGIVGGGLAFVLFFNGLAATTAPSAAFLRDTLVIWVAFLAVPILHERLRWWNVGAVVFLVAGEIVTSGGVGRLQLDHGELLVLASSLLWAVEVVVAKRLLCTVTPGTLAVIRMGVGSITLVVYLAVTGTLHELLSFNAGQVGWILLTGMLLAAYVGTWMTALARARALDVTSVLVGSAVVTWLLQFAAGTVRPSPQTLGLFLILTGVGVFLWANRRQLDLNHPVGPRDGST